MPQYQKSKTLCLITTYKSLEMKLPSLLDFSVINLTSISTSYNFNISFENNTLPKQNPYLRNLIQNRSSNPKSKYAKVTYE